VDLNAKSRSQLELLNYLRLLKDRSTGRCQRLGRLFHSGRLRTAAVALVDLLEADKVPFTGFAARRGDGPFLGALLCQLNLLGYDHVMGYLYDLFTRDEEQRITCRPTRGEDVVIVSLVGRPSDFTDAVFMFQSFSVIPRRVVPLVGVPGTVVFEGDGGDGVPCTPLFQEKDV
jgi:hypothetical protein